MFILLSTDDFWTRGHMPGLPLMPGVVICEAAAQLASYYVQKHDLLGAEMVGYVDQTRVAEGRIRGIPPPAEARLQDGDNRKCA